MRHLEKADHLDHSTNLLKDDYLNDLMEMKVEFPNILLDSCDTFMKNEFISDDETMNENVLKTDAQHDSDTSEEDMELITKNITRKNKRKALLPQRALQVEVSQTGSLGNSSESSQDFSGNLDMHFNVNNELNHSNIDNILLSDNESAIDVPDTDDLLQCDIFKDLREEAEGEKLDEEMLDNVKEEWKAHWGIKCNMCEQVFPHKTEFDIHYQDNYNLHPVYTCTFCNKSAEKYSTFRSHCYRHITEGRYKCRECPKGFSLQSMLQVHILAKHTKSKPFKCDECGRTFVTKPGLKIHIKKHTTETKEDYPCVECGKILHTRGGLTSHMNVHRLGRRFMCDVCGKTFTQKVNMQQHVKQHTGDKPHRCDKCGKTFAERSHLVRHYSFHSEERPYKCEVCQKMYKTERCLKVHSLVHAAARPFVCDYCNKGFLSSTKLKQHCNIHTGERPYKCNYCERTFTNYPNWLKHTRRRHKVDHKTGEELEPKKPILVQTVPKSEDINLSFDKNDEMLYQHNAPLNDDKLIIPQQIDFLGGTTNGLLVPYTQNMMQNPGSNTIPMQLTDLVYSTYLQQPLSCD